MKEMFQNHCKQENRTRGVRGSYQTFGEHMASVVKARLLLSDEDRAPAHFSAGRAGGPSYLLRI